MPGQMLMLENAHADGVTVFAVNKELMDQFTFCLLYTSPSPRD